MQCIEGIQNSTYSSHWFLFISQTMNALLRYFLTFGTMMKPEHVASIKSLINENQVVWEIEKSTQYSTQITFETTFQDNTNFNGHSFCLHIAPEICLAIETTIYQESLSFDVFVICSWCNGNKKQPVKPAICLEAEKLFTWPNKKMFKELNFVENHLNDKWNRLLESTVSNDMMKLN